MSFTREVTHTRKASRAPDAAVAMLRRPSVGVSIVIRDLLVRLEGHRENVVGVYYLMANPRRV